MIHNNVITNVKTQACVTSTSWFGGKERLKDFFSCIFIDPVSIILNDNQYLMIFSNGLTVTRGR